MAGETLRGEAERTRGGLAVRPYCHTDHYWQVYFDTNAVIKDALGEGGFPAPMPAQTIIMQQPAS